MCGYVSYQFVPMVGLRTPEQSRIARGLFALTLDPLAPAALTPAGHYRRRRGSELSRGDEVLYISSLAVSDKFRRRGVGSAMMRHVVAQASNRPACSAVALHVKVGNIGARKLYEKHGFCIVRRMSGYYGIGRDGYLMARYFGASGGASASARQSGRATPHARRAEQGNL